MTDAGWQESSSYPIDSRYRLAIGLLLAVGIGAVAVAGWSLAHAGIGWDARFDTQAALVTRSIGSSSSLDRAYELVPGTSEFYGVFPQQAADVLHRVATGSGKRLDPDDPATYAYQAIVTLIFSVLSVTALAVALAVAFRSVVAAVFAWSVTLSTPLWLGMSFVDFKDMPVAAGFTLVTAGIILSLSLRSSWAIAAGVSLGGIGGAIALSTRPGSLIVLGAMVVSSATGAFVIGRGGIRLLPVELTAFAAIAFAVAFTWATNPIGRIDLFEWLGNAAGVARSFDWDGTILTAGRDLRAKDLPWWYLPAWLGAQLPLLTLASVVGGFVALVVLLIRQAGVERRRTALPLVPVAAQAILMPLLIVGSGAVLYDGIRHVLFIIPALIAIPAGALALLTRRQGTRPRLAVLLPAAAVSVAAASLLASVRWAPYSYAFVNPVAGRTSDRPSWDLDYWGVSAREGVQRLQRMGLTPIHVAPSMGVGVPWGAATEEASSEVSGGLYVFLRSGQTAAGFGCTVAFTIKRDGHILGVGERCPG